MTQDCLFPNAGAFTTFEKLPAGVALYFNRCYHPQVGAVWFGPWENLNTSEGTAELAATTRRIETHYRVKVTKRR